MIKKASILLLLIYSIASFAQNENNIWMLGSDIGLDFNKKPITGPGSQQDVATFSADNINQAFSRKSSVCDENGDLLFYVDGKKIWNKNGEILEGGEELLTRQGSQVIFMTYIVKGECNQYFLFFGSNIAAGQSFLFYTVIDMEANDGLGRVDPTRRSIPLFSGNVRAFSTVSGYGKIWIVILDYDDSTNGKLQLFSLSRANLNFEKTIPLNFSRLYASTCEIKFSPDGTRFFIAESLFLTHDIPLKYYSFDKANGDVELLQEINSSSRFIEDYNTNIIAGEFSRSMKYFYTIERYGFCDQLLCYAHYMLFQYKLDQNKRIIPESKYRLHYIHEDVESGMSDLLLAPNDKIYVNRFENTQVDAIKNPDLREELAQFVEGEVSWETGYTSFRFPNLVLTERQIIRVNGPMDSLRLCANSELDLTVSQDYDDITWWDGSKDPSKTINSPGYYSVIIRDKTCEFKEEFQVIEQNDDNTMLPEDTTFCNDLELVLTDLTDKYERAIWNDGRNDLVREISEPGFYHVTAYKNDCKYVDSFELRQVRIPDDLLPSDTSMCENQYLTIDIGYPNARYTWGNGEITKAIRTNRPGEFSVIIQDGTCYGEAITFVSELEREDFIIERELEVCKGQSVNVSIDPNRDIFYEDGNLLVGNRFSIDAEGDHIFQYDIDKCTYSDTLTITHQLCIEAEVFMPNAFSPNGDGENDRLVFRVTDGVGYNGGRVMVFDRYGNRVWHSTEDNLVWDGTINGNQLAENGVYTVMVELEVTDAFGERLFTKAYDVTLLR